MRCSLTPYADISMYNFQGSHRVPTFHADPPTTIPTDPCLVSSGAE